MYLVNQMHQLGDALEAAGYTSGDLTMLCSSVSRLRELKDVLAGRSQIVVGKHVIDCDADPLVPNGWTVEKHVKGGQMEWDPARVRLYLSESQWNNKAIRGNQLREELRGKLTYNANLLDYLLAHPELIPEEWKRRLVFFWGTIYCYPDSYLVVRYLYWSGGRWRWHFRWLDGGFGDFYHTAVPASS